MSVKKFELSRAPICGDGMWARPVSDGGQRCADPLIEHPLQDIARADGELQLEQLLPHRVHDHDLLLERIRQHNLPVEAFQWYLDIRKYGTFPHSGFGMGIERVVAWVSGVPHLRETIPYPRMLNRIYP